ncbi:helix-turn-helix transcriptional regulator [Nocardia gamkensis]|uniref:helix-turn-helix transcriptional regulator n=1 Tax=Nocardia gamkensis TaxID=352869 RepID=UPI0037C7A2F1
MADLRDCSPFSEIFAQLNRIEQKLDQLQRSEDPARHQSSVEPKRERCPKQREQPVTRQPREYLTRHEAADYLRLSGKTLANWASSGSGPKSTRVGGKILYKLSDLNDYLAATDNPHG